MHCRDPVEEIKRKVSFGQEEHSVAKFPLQLRHEEWHISHVLN